MSNNHELPECRGKNKSKKKTGVINAVDNPADGQRFLNILNQTNLEQSGIKECSVGFSQYETKQNGNQCSHQNAENTKQKENSSNGRTNMQLQTERPKPERLKYYWQCLNLDKKQSNQAQHRRHEMHQESETGKSNGYDAKYRRKWKKNDCHNSQGQGTISDNRDNLSELPSQTEKPSGNHDESCLSKTFSSESHSLPILPSSSQVLASATSQNDSVTHANNDTNRSKDKLPEKKKPKKKRNHKHGKFNEGQENLRENDERNKQCHTERKESKQTRTFWHPSNFKKQSLNQVQRDNHRRFQGTSTGLSTERVLHISQHRLWNEKRKPHYDSRRHDTPSALLPTKNGNLEHKPSANNIRKNNFPSKSTSRDSALPFSPISSTESSTATSKQESIAQNENITFSNASKPDNDSRSFLPICSMQLSTDTSNEGLIHLNSLTLIDTVESQKSQCSDISQLRIVNSDEFQRYVPDHNHYYTLFEPTKKEESLPINEPPLFDTSLGLEITTGAPNIDEDVRSSWLNPSIWLTKETTKRLDNVELSLTNPTANRLGQQNMSYYPEGLKLLELCNGKEDQTNVFNRFSGCSIEGSRRQWQNLNQHESAISWVDNAIAGNHGESYSNFPNTNNAIEVFLNKTLDDQEMSNVKTRKMMGRLAFLEEKDAKIKAHLVPFLKRLQTNLVCFDTSENENMKKAIDFLIDS